MQNFGFNKAALKGIHTGKPITGSDAALAPLIKQLTKAALNAEIQSPILNKVLQATIVPVTAKKTVKSASLMS